MTHFSSSQFALNLSMPVMTSFRKKLQLYLLIFIDTFTKHGRDQVFLTSEPRTRLFSSHKCVRNRDSTKSCFPGRDRDRVRDLSPLLGETGTSPGPGPLHRYYPGPSLNSPGPRIFNRCDLKCSRFFNDGLTINVQNKINKLIQYLLKSFTGSHSNKIDQSGFAYGASVFW